VKASWDLVQEISNLASVVSITPNDQGAHILEGK